MKVQLIVVQGKPEGKVIPLTLPVFRIGRGETCHLRPSSEQVSREHAEFQIASDKVMVRDLGSRNGTLVNGKPIAGPCTLKDRDLVQVGPLTFAVAIEGAVSPQAQSPAPSKPASPDDVSHADIDSWLVADANHAVPERPSGVYRGETVTMNAFTPELAAAKAAAAPSPAPAAAPAPAPPAAKPAPAAAKPAAAKPAAPAPPADADDEFEYERLPEGEGDADGEDQAEESEGEDALSDEIPEDFIDESNPFYVKKKEPEGPAKPVYKDTSDAANDILRKMLERRRGAK